MALKIITACITEYGSTVSGYVQGTVLPFVEAKTLPSGNPDNDLFVAKWHVANACQTHFLTSSIRQSFFTHSRLFSGEV